MHGVTDSRGQKILREPSVLSKFLVPLFSLLLLTGGCSDDDDNPVKSPDELPEAIGWQWQNPYPRPFDLYSITFVDDQHGWAVGDEGTILATYDGGVN